MPAPAIVGAVVAAGFAMEATTTAVMVFSIAAAIGSTAAAVGQITGSKELTIAGTVLGAVGAIGGLASSAGLLGEAGSFFGMGGAEGVTNAAGGAVSEVTPAAANLAPAPTDGGTWNAVQAADPSLGTVQTSTAAVANGGPSNIVDTIAGTVTPPAVEVGPVTDVATAPATAINDVVSPDALVPNPASDIAAAPDPTQGLINQTSGTDMATASQAAVDTGGPVDAYGNPVAQGDGGMPGSPAGDGGAQVLNAQQTGDVQLAQATPSDANNPILGQDANPAPAVNGQAGTPTNASSTPNSTADPSRITGVPQGTAQPAAAVSPADPSSVGRQILVGGKPVTIGANPGLDAGIPGSFDLTRATLAGTPPAPVDGGSAWSNIWKFTKDNPGLALGGVMAASSFLSGAMSPLTPAQTRALDTQAQQNLAAANLANSQNEMIQRRLDNMRQGIPQARWKNGTGLVNMAPVTGVPA